MKLSHVSPFSHAWEGRAYAARQHVSSLRRGSLRLPTLPTHVKTGLILGLFLGTVAIARADIPASIVVEGVPPIPPELRADAGRYLEFRAAAFNSWHPVRRELLITTRFADTPQLHLVKQPGGARQQLTFLSEPVAGGQFQPVKGEYIVFLQDVGGGEFYQLYRCDLADGRVTLLTNGKSRNTGPRWGRSGRQLAYTSTRRNGKDNDIYVMDPFLPTSDRRVLEVSGGGWQVEDWSPDETKLALMEYVSINESYLHLLDLATGTNQLLTPKQAVKVAYGQARFVPGTQALLVTTDRDSEFQRLYRFDLATGEWKLLTGQIPWDVDEFEISPDGQVVAFVTNENGVGKIHLLNLKTGKELPAPELPLGIPGNLKWHENGADLAFNLSSARSPNDVYSWQLKTRKLERWTESETGGLNPQTFVEPQLKTLKSFDGLAISAFHYHPDRVKFPGRRPVLVSIHGGPESQSRPGFQARNNYYLNELGIALVYPNVRGSSGYGKTFLTLDNGFKREDSVKDIGAILEWVRNDERFAPDRIAVTGGSYGGYMVLASMVLYNDVLRCGVDVVGISSFLTFLKNTQDYRRDLRRVEYGDERDEAMRAFLEKISPLNHVDKIKKPLLVVQGANDPRVPLSEAEQMAKAIRENGGQVWYVMARDEGHGFGKKKNADYQFLATILFLKAHLLR